MKLCTFNAGTGTRAGVIVNDRVIDCATLLNIQGQGALPDVRALLELPDEPLQRLKAAVEGITAPQGHPISSIKLMAPVLRPPTVRDFMVYEGHATGGGTRKQAEAWYRMPVFYFSNPLIVYGPDDVVPYPDATEALDYEFEIGVVIGKETSNVKEADWLSVVAGFTVFNDWSCRDIQRDEQAVGLGPAKGKDTGNAMGPVMVTPDELDIRDGQVHANVTLRVNGNVWMTNNSGTAYHNWGTMIERASKDSRIAIGDVLGSGTITGGSIGEAIRDGIPNARFLQPGDVVEMEVEGLGTLRNTIGPKVVNDASYRFRCAPGVFVMPTPVPMSERTPAAR